MKPAVENAQLKSKIKELESQLKMLADEKKILDEILDSVPGEFFVYNEKRLLIRWNKKHEEVTGYPGAESLGKDPTFFFEGPEVASINEAVEKVYREGIGTVEGTLLTKEGEKIPHLYSAVRTTIGGEAVLLGFGLDISELKETQKQLESSRKLYELLAENLSEGVLIANREITFYTNSALSDILQLSIDEITQMPPWKFFHEKKDFEAILGKVTKGEEFANPEILYVRENGDKVWLGVHCRPIEWENKKALVATIRDNTQIRENRILDQRKTRQLKKENKLLKSKYSHPYGLAHLIGKSPKMQDVYDEILTAASLDTSVVVYGESGTGKELTARSIHDLSQRRDAPFIAVNCGAIPENLFESEFFGHKKGAFSGAAMDKIGFFESAEKGTLFLDEIGEIPLNQQVKLLRVMDGSGYSPVGSAEVKKVDVRIIAATNRDLKQLVREGRVREDFYYRVHVLPISLPPLRERKEDLPLLIYHFIEKSGDDENNRKYISDADMEKFRLYDWPGNVRELQNTIARYEAFNTVELEGFQNQGATPEISISTDDMDLNRMVDEYEKQIIQKVLESTGGVKTRAAKKLKIQRRSLLRKIQRLGI